MRSTACSKGYFSTEFSFSLLCLFTFNSELLVFSCLCSAQPHPSSPPLSFFSFPTASAIYLLASCMRTPITSWKMGVIKYMLHRAAIGRMVCCFAYSFTMTTSSEASYNIQGKSVTKWLSSGIDGVFRAEIYMLSSDSLKSFSLGCRNLRSYSGN